MKIILDGTVYSSSPSGGIYRYFNELLPRISSFSGAEVQVYTPRTDTLPPANPSIRLHIDHLPSGSWFPEGPVKNVLRAAKKQIQAITLKKQVGDIRSAVFHSTAYTLPPWKKITQVVTVYDMISEIFPKIYDLTHIRWQREAKTKCLKSATRVIAISEQTKKDLQKIFNIPADIIDVIYFGLDNAFYAEKKDTDVQNKILKKYYLNQPYFLFVGGRLHHKNFERFVTAFAHSGARKDYLLAVGGFPAEKHEEELVKKLGIDTQIRWMPYLTDELPTVYQQAKCFAFPSYYEGFGLPLIEAMAAGCPVIASNAGPFPELSEGAALLFDPFDEGDMVKAIEQVLDDKTCQSLVTKGKIQASKFNWDKTAKETYQTYQKALQMM